LTTSEFKLSANDGALLSLPIHHSAPATKPLMLIVLAVVLVHGVILLVSKSSAPIENINPPNVIDVSLDTSPIAPPTHTAPPARPLPPTPIPPKIKPDAMPTESAKPEPLTPTPPSTTPAMNSPNNEAAAPVIQPLFKLSRMPSFSRKSEPIYPASERRAGIQATVIAEVTINEQGKVLSVKILKSGGTNFDEAVKAALQQSEFSAGLIDGKPVGARFQVPYRFSLN